MLDFKQCEQRPQQKEKFYGTRHGASRAPDTLAANGGEMAGRGYLYISTSSTAKTNPSGRCSPKGTTDAPGERASRASQTCGCSGPGWRCPGRIHCLSHLV